MSGNVDDADDALIDESTLFQIMDSLISTATATSPRTSSWSRG